MLKDFAGLVTINNTRIPKIVVHSVKNTRLDKVSKKGILSAVHATAGAMCIQDIVLNRCLVLAGVEKV